MVRLIFSDIDGTLINSNFKVTPKTRQGIKQIVAQGVLSFPYQLGCLRQLLRLWNKLE